MAELAAFLIEELGNYDQRADFSNLDKESWKWGYRTAMRMVAECCPYFSEVILGWG